MEPTASDKRKLRCLAASLVKAGIDRFDKIGAEHQALLAGHSFQSVVAAIEIAERALSPQWKKRVKKMLGDDGIWRPSGEAQWVEFEEARKGPLKTSCLIFERSCFVWSPVELWTIIKRNRYYHIQSTLTGEGWYVIKSPSDFMMTEGGVRPELPKTRSATNPMGSATERCLDQLPRTKWEPASQLIKNIITEAKFL